METLDNHKVVLAEIIAFPLPDLRPAPHLSSATGSQLSQTEVCIRFWL